MKKLLAMIMCLCVILSLAACGTTPNTEEGSAEEGSVEQSYRDFLSDFTTKCQDIAAVNARVGTDAEGNKVLMADIKNAGNNEISNIVISFATWDADGNFITIKSRKNPDNTQAEFQVDLTNVSIPERSIWNADKGVYLDASCDEIAYVKAVVISCKNGEYDYNNELYAAWKETYLQQSLSEWMRTIDAEFDPKQQLAELRKHLATETVYISKSAVWKNFDDEEVCLTANVKNDSEQTVTGFAIAFVAWDEIGTPVYISTPSDDANSVADRNYIKTGKLSDAEILAGEEWIGCENENGEVIGLQVDFEHSNIDYVEAIVVSYTTADGQTHESPYYTEWANYYSGILLENWMKAEVQ